MRNPNFNLRSYPMKAEVKTESNFEQSCIKSNKIGIHSLPRPTILLYLFCYNLGIECEEL